MPPVSLYGTGVIMPTGSAREEAVAFRLGARDVGGDGPGLQAVERHRLQGWPAPCCTGLQPPHAFCALEAVVCTWEALVVVMTPHVLWGEGRGVG